MFQAMPNEISLSDDSKSIWETLPDNILLHVFSFLADASSILQASLVCKTWHRIAHDEFLWRDLFYKYWKIDASIPRAPGKVSWLQEYRRLYFQSPLIESEVLKAHRDQVLHVSHSHAGDLFATCSKDGFVKVWNTGYPASVRYSADLHKFNWKYTQYSQFNKSDTLLLVSGVHFGSHSTSGEIAVFSLTDDFELQCRVINKPYDIFGTWYNDTYLLSGNLHWLGSLSSASSLWLNKAYQESDSEKESVVMRLFKFRNVNASSIRTIMIAECHQPDEKSQNDTSLPQGSVSPDDPAENEHTMFTQCKQIKDIQSPGRLAPCCQKMQLLPDKGCRLLLLEVDDSSVDDLNSIEYNTDYRVAEGCDMLPHSWPLPDGSHECNPLESMGTQDDVEMKTFPPAALEKDSSDTVTEQQELDWESMGASSGESQSDDVNTRASTSYANALATNQVTRSEAKSLSRVDSDESTVTPDQESLSPCNKSPVFRDMLDCDPMAGSSSSMSETDGDFRDRYLIFTTGKKTYTPHQIGIKRIKSLEASKMVHRKTSSWLQEHEEESQDGDGQKQEFDNVDHLIELDGHIIGMCLSPDHRYLYVNSRPWPKDNKVTDPLYPPPIAQEIDIHVIDLHTKQEVGTMLRAHKAYTPNDECFFIFLDVCEEYVASGAEDKHGYLWDRHYGVLLTKFPHTDVVNSVSFNPRDPEVLVTVSDDCSIKIWRSRNREIEVKGTLGKTDSLVERTYAPESPVNLSISMDD